MDSKKIVIVVSHLGLGGAERVTAVIASQFAKLGHDVHLIVFSKKYRDYEVDDNVKTIYMPEYSKKCIRVIKQIGFYKRKLKSINPDCVIALGMYRQIMISGTLGKYNYITSERNDPKQHSTIDSIIHRYVFSRSKKVVFQTQEAREYYSDIEDAKTEIIPNPIKADLPDIYTGDREKRIVAFSRLTGQKNIPLLLSAFAAFSNVHNEFCLDIYGEGECRNELEALTRSLHIENKVCFKGYTKDIHEQIKKASMFVSSSDYEGISNSMIEAMAMGLPVICTDCPCGGARMMIENGVNGYLIPVGDEHALFERMCYVAEHPEEAKKTGRDAALIRHRLSTNIIVSKWEKLMTREI